MILNKKNQEKTLIIFTIYFSNCSTKNCPRVSMELLISHCCIGTPLLVNEKTWCANLRKMCPERNNWRRYFLLILVLWLQSWVKDMSKSKTTEYNGTLLTFVSCGHSDVKTRSGLVPNFYQTKPGLNQKKISKF